MKKSFIFLVAFYMTAALYAGMPDTISIGLSGGYDSYKTLRGELYLKYGIKLFNHRAEMKAGINNRSYTLDFDNVNDLKASSIGLFGDVAIYPFRNGLFAGLRWELINFNWLTADSKSKIEDARDYSPASLYTGTCVFLQLGYNFKISDNTAIKIYGQPGVQQFKITNGSSVGSFGQGSSSGDLIVEDHYEFIYNINLSIEFRLK
jgi:hypothetical protein